MGLRKRYYQPEGIDAYTMSLDLSRASSASSATADTRAHFSNTHNGAAMSKPIVLGIESTSDETAAAWCRDAPSFPTWSRPPWTSTPATAAGFL